MKSVRFAPLVVPALATAASADARAEERERVAVGVPGEASSPPPGVRAFPEGSAAAADDAAIDALEADLERILEGRILGPSETAVYVVDAFSGEPIYERKIDEPLNPASNVKLVATAAALDILGADWRYQTRVYGPAPRRGAIEGDLYLRGGADPTLAPSDLAALAAEVADAGARRLSGDLVVGPWTTRDAVGLAPIEVEVRGTEAGEPPEVEIDSGAAETAFFEVDSDAETVSRGRTRTRISKEETGGDGIAEERALVRVRGRIRAGESTTRTLWIENRAAFTAHALRAELEDAGVEVEGSLRRARFDDYSEEAAAEGGYLPIELARHESAPMSEIVARVNKSSSNFLADRVAMSAGAKLHGGELSMRAGLSVMDFWLERAGLDPDDMVLDTGSGLSYETELSARQIIDILRVGAGYGSAAPPPLSPAGARAAAEGSSPLAERAARVANGLEPGPADIHPTWARGLGGESESFVRSLPVAGVDGTLRTRFRRSQARERVLAKTGTLRNIIALSGFIEGRDDHKIGFAIVTNDHRPGHRVAVREEQAEIVEVLYEYLDNLSPAPSRPVAGDPPQS